MKRLLSFIALLSLASVSLAQISGFPTYQTSPVSVSALPPVSVTNTVATSGSVTNRVATQSRNSGLSNANESRQIVNAAIVSTQGSAYINLFDGMVTGTNWQTAPNSNTFTANTLKTITNGNFQPDPGRKYVIRRITIWSNLPTNVMMQKQYSLAGTLYGTTGAISQGTVLQQFVETAVKTDTQSVWKAVFDFSADDPLVIRYGERLISYYSRNATQQPNFRISVIGRDKTNSDNDTAPYRHLFIGDSKTGITPDGSVVQYQKDFWPFMLVDSLSANGYNTEPVNIAISGTTVSDWDWLAKTGRLDGIPFSSYTINLGTNDMTVGTSVLSSGGNDGTFTQGLKYIITKLHALNPLAPGFIDNIGPTDLTARQAALSGGRTEIAAVCTWAQAKGWPVYHVDNTNIFPTTDKTNFVSSEQAVNGSTHESAKGLLAEFNAMWPVFKVHLGQLKPVR